MIETLIFRGDGDSKIGLGHLYRLIALAEVYKDSYEVIFVTSSLSDRELIPDYFSHDFLDKDLSIKDEPIYLAEVYDYKRHVIIADGYNFNSRYQEEIKRKGFKLIYIDDMCAEHMYADIVINHALGVTRKDYHSETYTIFALGPGYSILRPSFQKINKSNRRTNQLKNVLICFGGADPLDLSYKAVLGCLESTSIDKISVVVGAGYKHSLIFNLEKNTPNLRVFFNLDEEEMAHLLLNNDLAIVSASTTLYEACSVNMYILCGYYVNNQSNLYYGAISEGLVSGLGDISSFSKDDFRNAIETIGKKELNNQIENQRRVFNGNSYKNLQGLLDVLLCEVRMIEANDLHLIYKWSNDKVVRENSFNPEPITLESHKVWFDKKIRDPKCYFYICLINKTPAGFVRYDRKQDHSLVSVVVSEKYRGKGFASTFLIKSDQEYFDCCSLPIIAQIKNDNIGSIKSFEKAHYRELKDSIFNKENVKAYKLERNDRFK